MVKFYIGKRGSGKTVTLLREAAALVEEGFEPVFICAGKHFEDVLRYRADKMDIDLSGVRFITVHQIKDKTLTLPKKENTIYLIDDLAYFIQASIGLSRGTVHATIEEAECENIKRSD